MASFTGVVFSHHKRQDGSTPAKIRITHNRKTKYLLTNIVFYPDQLTKAFKMKNCTPKYRLDELVRSYTEKISSVRVGSMDIDEIIKFVTQEDLTGRIDFLAVYKQEISEMTNKGTAGIYQTALNHLQAYTGGICYAEDIDYEFVKKYAAYISEHTQGRAVSLYLGCLRHILNQAKKTYNKEEIGIYRIPLNPFAKFKIPEQPATRKRALNIEAIRQIRDLPDNGTRWNLARDVFMLSFYLMGMNTVDLYCFDKTRNGRIEYERMKTKGRRRDRAFISIEVPPEALAIIERNKGRALLFDFSERYTDKQNFNKAVNLGLKQIEKHFQQQFDKSIASKAIPEDAEFKLFDLEFYAARHSWATIAMQIGVDKFIVHECLNHVIPEMKVTDIYIDKDWSILDRANRRVLDALGLIG